MELKDLETTFYQLGNQLLLSILTFVVAKLIYNYVHWIVVYRPKLKSFPQLENFSYFTGHFSTHSNVMLKNPEKHLPHRLNLAKKYPNGYWEAWHPMTRMSPWINVHDPVAVKAVLTLKYDKAPKYQPIVKPFMIGTKPYSIFFCNGDMWKNHRHVINLQFNQKLLKAYMPVVNNCVKTMIDKWQSRIDQNSDNSEYSEPFNIHQDFMLLTLDVLLQTLMSYESDCQTSTSIEDGDKFVAAVVDWLSAWHSRMESPLGLSEFLYTTFSFRGRKNLKSAKYMYEVALKLVMDRQDLYREDPDYQSDKERLDLIDILVAGSQENGKPFTYDEIIMETIIFMIAGFETTANTLTWTLSHLARSRTDYLSKIYPEVDQLTEELKLRSLLNFDKGHENLLEQKDLDTLAFMDSAIKETLRITPIGQRIFSRVMEKDILLPDGRNLPAGVPIHINILDLHRREDLFPNPDDYIPERFLSKEISKNKYNQTKIDPFAYIPFSAGARNCIGRHFANQEMRSTLFHIFEKFEISAEGCQDPVAIIKITLRPQNGIFLKIKNRVL